MIKILQNYPFTCEDYDRRHNRRVYFRVTGLKKVRLRSPVGSPEFDAEYGAALEAFENGTLAKKARAEVEKTNTWRWLCKRYMANSDFQGLDESTQRPRRGILESTWAEPIKPGSAALIGDCPIDRMTPQIVRLLRDRKKDLPGAANGRLKAIRGVFKWAIENDLATANPVRDVQRLRTRIGGFHAWTEDEAAQFEARWAVGTKERLAFALLRYLGVRRSDVVRLGKQHLRDRSIKFDVRKGRNRTPNTLELQLPERLVQAIEAGPTGDLTFLVTEYGRPFADAGFGNWFRERCNLAGLPHCSAHGLRKLAATSLAEAGATPHHLMAWFGWRSIREAETYTRAASQKKLAADAAAIMRRGK